MEQNFKIAVPEGCTANIEKKDNFVIVSFGPKKWVPKDGDIIAFGEYGIGIFKAYDYIGHEEYATYVDELYFNETGWVDDNMRPATEEEKQRLFDALAKKGKRWNAEEKRIEDLPRWRANLAEVYFYIDDNFSIGSPFRQCKEILHRFSGFFLLHKLFSKKSIYSTFTKTSSSVSSVPIVNLINLIVFHPN